MFSCTYFIMLAKLSPTVSFLRVLRGLPSFLNAFLGINWMWSQECRALAYHYDGLRCLNLKSLNQCGIPVKGYGLFIYCWVLFTNICHVLHPYLWGLPICSDFFFSFYLYSVFALVSGQKAYKINLICSNLFSGRYCVELVLIVLKHW